MTRVLLINDGIRTGLARLANHLALMAQVEAMTAAEAFARAGSEELVFRSSGESYDSPCLVSARISPHVEGAQSERPPLVPVRSAVSDAVSARANRPAQAPSGYG